MTHMDRVIKATTLYVFFALAACGDDTIRQEEITNLRGIGVEQSPIIAKPGSVVTLTFHMAAPQGKSISATPYIDSVFRYGTSTKVTLIDTVPSEQKLGAISTYTLRASFTVPSDAATVASLESGTPLRTRYGVTFNDGSRTENIVGDTLIYKTSTPDQVAPTITIDQPLTTDISTTTSISSTITNSIVEDNRVSWFVSSGEIKNRRAKSTEWSKIGSGEQTLIVTTRGAKSGAFAMKTVKVTVR